MQVVVATITSDADAYAREVIAAAEKAGLRAEADLRNEKITYKVREHSLAKVPVLLVVGRKEAAERTVSIRRLGSQEQRSQGLAPALADLAAEALPPDRRRTSAEDEGRPEEHLALDGHHVIARDDRLTPPLPGDAAPSQGQRRHSRWTSAAVRPMSLSCSSLKGRGRAAAGCGRGKPSAIGRRPGAPLPSGSGPASHRGA